MNAISRFPKRIYYFFIGIIMSICLTLDIPMRAIGPELDLTGYKLVWNDEFEGDALDTSKWAGHCCTIGGQPSEVYEGGYYSDSAIRVENGNLILSIRKEDGSDPKYPAGWYFGAIDSSPGFNSTYGYYEIRAKLAKATAGNCAFFT